MAEGLVNDQNSEGIGCDQIGVLSRYFPGFAEENDGVFGNDKG
jgi:hypothetical protein